MSWEDTIQDTPHIESETPVVPRVESEVNVDSAQPISNWENTIQDTPHAEPEAASNNLEKIGTGLAYGAKRGTTWIPDLVGRLAGEKDWTSNQSAKLERFLVDHFGDEKTKEYYHDLSHNDLKNTYQEQETKAAEEAPGSYLAGNLIGSLPSSFPVGAGMSSVAKGVSGVNAAKVAGQAATLPMRLGQGAAMAGQMGALGEVQGISESNAPTLGEKAIEALPTAGTMALLGGAFEGAGIAGSPQGQAALGQIASKIAPALGATAETVGNILKPVAKYGTAALAGGIGVPLITGTAPGLNARTAEGIAAGLIAPYFLSKTSPGKAIGESYQYGRKGTSLWNQEDFAREAAKGESLANKASQGILQLDQNISQPATQRILNIYQNEVKQVGTDLNLNNQQLTNLLSQAKTDAGQAIEAAYKQAAEQGKTLVVGDLINGMKEQLENAISKGLVPGETDQVAVQNIIKSLNDRLVKRGLPIQIDSTRILNADGTPFLQSSKIAGKNVTLEQLQAQAQQPGQTIPTAASITNQTMNLQGAPQVQQILKQGQALTPQEPVGPLDIPAVRELKGVLGNAAFEDASIPPAAKPIIANGYRQLNDLMAPLFENEGQNSYLKNNQKYTALKQIGDVVGEPIPDRVTGERLPPTKLIGLVDKIGTALKSGDSAKFDAIIKNLQVIDPQKAAEFSQTLQQLSKTQSTLVKGINQGPLEQSTTLQQLGKSTPEVQQAAKQVQDIETLKNRVGVPQQIGEKTTASPESRQIIDNLHELDQIGTNTDLNATLELLSKYNPELAQKLATEGVDVSRRLNLIGKPGEKIPYLARPFHAVQKFGTTSIPNITGLGVKWAGDKLGSLLKTTPQVLGKFAAPLQEANTRGTAALTAMHYALYNSDPQYRETIDPLQTEAERETPGQ